MSRVAERPLDSLLNIRAKLVGAEVRALAESVNDLSVSSVSVGAPQSSPMSESMSSSFALQRIRGFRDDSRTAFQSLFGFGPNTI